MAKKSKSPAAKRTAGRRTLFANEPKQRMLLAMRSDVADRFAELGGGNLSQGIELAIEKVDVDVLAAREADDRDPERSKYNLTLRKSTRSRLMIIGRSNLARGAAVLGEAIKRSGKRS